MIDITNIDIKHWLKHGLISVYDIIVLIGNLLKQLKAKLEALEEKVDKIQPGKPTILVDAPTAGSALTYNGNEQTFVCGNNASIADYVTVTNNTGTNAGSYTATYTLKADDTNYSYKWKDGTTAAKTLAWSIGKANSTITWSTSPASSITIGNSLTFAATTSSGGTIKFYKGSVAEANEITSPYTPSALGTIKIIAHESGADSNHNAASDSEKSVSVNEVSFPAYRGVAWVSTSPTNDNIADSIISQMDAATTTKNSMNTVSLHDPSSHSTTYLTSSIKKTGQFALHFFLLPKMNAYTTWKVQQCFFIVGGGDEDLYSRYYAYCNNVEKTYNGKTYRVYAICVPNGEEDIDFCLNKVTQSA